MQIVIEIPEDYYKDIKEIPAEQSTADMLIIRYGIPLPKGHGRLIDADALMEYCQNDINKTVDCNDIARFPTIIEADKAGEEE